MMGCKDIQERLSAYIDGVLSSEEKALIDKHLHACQKCREAFSELNKTVEYLKKLEEIEPPSWLSQKIMAKIKKEAEPKKGILQRLFYPLHIKLPIEAVAAIFIAVTAVYLYRAIEPQKKLAEGPTEIIARNEVSRIPEQSEGYKAISKGKAPAPLAQVDKKDEKPVIKEVEPTAAKESIDETDKYTQAPAAKPPISPFSKGGQKGDLKKEKAVQPAGDSVKEETRQRTAAAEPELKRTLADKKEDVISITISVKNIETASKEIEKITVQLKGRIIKKEPSENKNLITAELDAKKIKELLEKLKPIGEIKKKIGALGKHEGIAKIKIEVVM